jgi:vacuolar-type H+-ATPase subunit C/Vma6
LSAKNLTELRAAFSQTNYDSIIGDLNFETQISEVARRLKNAYAGLLVKFYNQSSSSVQKKIQLFSERYNAENLRIILHGIHVGMKHEDIIARLIPVANYSLDYYTKLLSKSIDEIISVQKEESLQKQLRKAFEEFKSTESFTPLESAIDQYVYSVLPKVSKHYETYVNMKNILSLCRCITLDIPAYRYILPNKFIAKGLKAETVSEVLELYNVSPYSLVFSDYIGAKEIPLHELEFAVERFLLKTWRKTFRYGTVFQLDSLIGFFELKLAETMDIIRIMVGVNAGFSEEEIRENLLFYGII